MINGAEYMNWRDVTLAGGGGCCSGQECISSGVLHKRGFVQESTYGRKDRGYCSKDKAERDLVIVVHCSALLNPKFPGVISNYISVIYDKNGSKP